MESTRHTAQGSALDMTPTLEAAHEAARRGAPAGLSWTAFSERYFPGRRRHDLEVLRAFARYTNGGRGEPANREAAKE